MQKVESVNEAQREPGGFVVDTESDASDTPIKTPTAEMEILSFMMTEEQSATLQLNTLQDEIVTAYRTVTADTLPHVDLLKKLHSEIQKKVKIKVKTSRSTSLSASPADIDHYFKILKGGFDAKLTDGQLLLFETDFLIVSRIVCAKFNIVPLQMNSNITFTSSRAAMICGHLLKPIIESWKIKALPDMKRKSLKRFLEALREYDHLSSACMIDINDNSVDTAPDRKKSGNSEDRSSSQESATRTVLPYKIKIQNRLKKGLSRLKEWFLDLFKNTVSPTDPLHEAVGNQLIKMIQKNASMYPDECKQCRETLKNWYCAEAIHEIKKPFFFETFLKPKESILPSLSFFHGTEKERIQKILSRYDNDSKEENSITGLLLELTKDVNTLERMIDSQFKSTSFGYENAEEQMQAHLNGYVVLSDRIAKFQEILYAIRHQYEIYFREKYPNEATYLAKLDDLTQGLLSMHLSVNKLIDDHLIQSQAIAINLQDTHKDTLIASNKVLTSFNEAERYLAELTWLQAACCDSDIENTVQAEMNARNKNGRPPYHLEKTYTLSDVAVFKLEKAMDKIKKIQALVHPDKYPAIAVKIIAGHCVNILIEHIKSAQHLLEIWNASQYAIPKTEQVFLSPEFNNDVAKPTQPLNSSILILHQDYLTMMQKNPDQYEKKSRGIAHTPSLCKLDNVNDKNTKIALQAEKKAARLKLQVEAAQQKATEAAARADQNAQEATEAKQEATEANVRADIALYADVAEKIADNIKFKTLNTDIAQSPDFSSNQSRFTSLKIDLTERIYKKYQSAFSEEKIQSAILAVLTTDPTYAAIAALIKHAENKTQAVRLAESPHILLNAAQTTAPAATEAERLKLS